MTDDLVKHLRDAWTEDGVSSDFDEDVLLIAADRIEELNRAVLDLAEYVSSADLGFFIEPETKKVLSEIGEKKDD
jgi:hypothetical protein